MVQLAVLLHAQGGRLGSHVLLLDEPEDHLHPDVLLDVLNRLRTLVPNGQLWIATHSLHALAWAPPDAVWFVEDGKASWAGRSPERVLSRLLGDEERRGALELFLQLPAQLAACRFAAECLLAPTVSDTAANDPQLLAIRAALPARTPPSPPLRILDFGAGRGRLLSALHAERASTEVSALVDYLAIDPGTEWRSEREGRIDAAYGLGTASRRSFDGIPAARQHIDAHSVDVVVMCNVLHEVDPRDWPGLFAGLHGLLRPNGALIVVEDLHIPVGERAHRDGFLLLDGPHLARLFARRESDPPLRSHYSLSGRVGLHVVPASIIGRVSAETRADALRVLVETSKAKLVGMGQRDPSFRNGQLYALYGQLFANASLALEAFDPHPEPDRSRGE